MRENDMTIFGQDGRIIKVSASTQEYLDYLETTDDPLPCCANYWEMIQDVNKIFAKDGESQRYIQIRRIMAKHEDTKPCKASCDGYRDNVKYALRIYRFAEKNNAHPNRLEEIKKQGVAAREAWNKHKLTCKECGDG